MSRTLFTVGYEKRTIGEILAILALRQVDVLIDVRDVPWSHKPGFAKAVLERLLPDAGIAYVHAGFAGNPKWLRELAETSDDTIGLYRWYLDQFPEVDEAFESLVAGLQDQQKTTCIMCFERDPATCHRSVLSTRWRARAPRSRNVCHLGLGDR